MALLFANTAEEFVMKRNQQHDDLELSSKVSDLFDVIDGNGASESVVDDGLLPQQRFVTSVANEYYKKSKEDINNTSIGNKSVRKKNFQQIMKESFFYGANRFGTNFIA